MADQMDATMARLNVTWNGANGDLPDPVAYDMPKEDLIRVAAEAIRGGYIPGIPMDLGVDLTDFEVDRFPATESLPNRLFLRPKTPFGFSLTENLVW